jgi:predicted RNase H-like nuclease
MYPTSINRSSNSPANSILAIDAAWTASEPSAVALLQQLDNHWHCRALAPSYAQFISLSNDLPVDWSKKTTGQVPDMAQLLNAAINISGQKPAIITVDMPVSNVLITGYRAAERAIAKAFSKKGCAAHAPSATRPGKISEAYTKRLEQHGFELGVVGTEAGTVNRLLEVYPHPALLRLMNAEYRLEYKAGKTSRYWPELSISERKQKLYYIYKNILAVLGQVIQDIDLDISESLIQQPFSHFKRYEDAIDALVCGWVGMQYLAGKASAHGDDSGAIWVPD